MAPGSNMSSESKCIVHGVSTSLIPALRVAAAPGMEQFDMVHFNDDGASVAIHCWATLKVLSDELLSTMIKQQRSIPSCEAIDRSVGIRISALFQTGNTIDKTLSFKAFF